MAEHHEPRASVRAAVLGFQRELASGSQLTFGRDPGTDLCFPDDDRLSRYAGQLWLGVDGLLLRNTSTRHSLVLDSSSGSAELEPYGPAGFATAVVLGRGEATVTVPWTGSACRLLVDLHLPEPESLPAEQAMSTRTTRDHGLYLQQDTKLFVTALLLCRPLLAVAAADRTVAPSIPELTRAILATTDSFHLLRDFDAGSVRGRLTGRVHDQLRELRTKVVRHGLVSPGSKLPPPALAELLVRHRVITRRHLRLLEDPAWRDAQAELWWR